jgi:hypothetical protein
MFNRSLLAAIALALSIVSAVWAGTPFGGEDTGFLPPDSPTGPIAKCELAIAKNVEHFIKCVMKCHQDRALGRLTSDDQEDMNCEAGPRSCEVKYENARARFDPKCSSGADCAVGNEDNIVALVETQLDANNGAIYCASASGAFIDGAIGF